MHKQNLKRIAAVAAAVMSMSMIVPIFGQNITSYDSIPNPYLFLLREPAVQKDLKLSAKQYQELQQLNDSMDGQLLAQRNIPTEKADVIINSLLAKTTAGIQKILDVKQRLRLAQIMLRVRGIKLVLEPQVGDRLSVTPEQKAALQEIVDNTAEKMKVLSEQLKNGKPRGPIEAAARRHRQREYEKILAALSDPQKRALASVLGPIFDVSKLGKAKFKAPELVQSTWINSSPLTMEELQGQVVVLHFYAYG